jgi:hypothetical protein
MTLQSLQFFFRLDDLGLSEYLWKLKHIRRYPVRWPLFGDEFSLSCSMGDGP